MYSSSNNKNFDWLKKINKWQTDFAAVAVLHSHYTKVAVTK
jgi:hypothetical protein